MTLQNKTKALKSVGLECLFFIQGYGFTIG